MFRPKSQALGNLKTQLLLFGIDPPAIIIALVEQL